MRLNPQAFGVAIKDLTARIDAAEAENIELKEQMDELKEIVHNALTKHNPSYKKKIALGEVDDFLGKRFGETRP